MSYVPRALALLVVPFACAAVGCSQSDSGAHPDAAASVAPSGTAPAVTSAVVVSDGGSDGAAPADAAPAATDTRPLHFTTQEDLLALIDLPPKGGRKKHDPMPFLLKAIGPGGPARGNQGNAELAKHEISRTQCLAGLAGVTLQTDEQRTACKDRVNMVPIYRGGDPAKAKTCIDVFEFPNKPCELPFVWVPPHWAQEICSVQGKRLCTQEEWVLACSGDPAGGKPSRHAYGDELDLTVCHTQRSARALACDPDSAASAWKTCPTNTEPTGSFPRCRSRFGVFDQHGNVAEAMTRADPDGHVYSQLKGSAFFYVDVARKPGDAPKRETYPDHCGHDPRWHVEPIRKAFHVNYHLGFRCCLSLD
jgi:hypothetical protein